MAKKIEGEEPNVVFIGGRFDTSGKNLTIDKDGVVPDGFVSREPITKFNDGMTTVRMPPVEEQMKPFYHKEAGRIVRLWPKLYKPYVSKKGDQF